MPRLRHYGKSIYDTGPASLNSRGDWRGFLNSRRLVEQLVISLAEAAGDILLEGLDDRRFGAALQNDQTAAYEVAYKNRRSGVDPSIPHTSIKFRSPSALVNPETTEPRMELPALR